MLRHPKSKHPCSHSQQSSIQLGMPLAKAVILWSAYLCLSLPNHHYGRHNHKVSYLRGFSFFINLVQRDVNKHTFLWLPAG